MFTQNQVRQLYVVKSVVTGANQVTNPGDIKFKGTFGTTDFYFEYMSTDGKVQRSDMIDGALNQHVNAVFTDADNLGRTSNATIITLDPNYLNNGAVINGQDYMVNIRIQQCYFKSDLIDTWKHGVVHGAGNMAAKTFYAKMALSLYANFSREAWPILKFGVTTSDTTDNSYTIAGDTNITWIDKTSTIDGLTGTYTALIVDEVPQDWHLGKMEQEPVIYDAHCDYIIYSGDDVIWGKTTVMPGSVTFTNGKTIADMEWFYHGERGDIYREYGYPNNFDNVALADPTKKYDTFDIHYFWQGANHAVQKSEKDITLVVDDTLTSVVSAVKSALGIS